MHHKPYLRLNDMSITRTYLISCDDISFVTLSGMVADGRDYDFVIEYVAAELLNMVLPNEKSASFSISRPVNRCQQTTRGLN